MSRINSPDSLEKRDVLLEFTRELIRHSSQGEISNLKSVLGKKSVQRENVLESRRRTPDALKKSIISSGREATGFVGMVREGDEIRTDVFPRKKPRVIEYINPLVIPRTQLPPRFQYLKPTPTKLDIDLGKLNSLVKDPMVGEIECQGANQKIIVSGTMGRRKTDISLTREEIEDVINKFSEVSKIPVQEGVFKIVAGRFIFSAIVSNLITSRFIIKKMDYNPGFRR